MSYKVLYQAGEDEIEEKKSRFIAHTLPVNSEDEAVAFLNKIKKEYWDAFHVRYDFHRRIVTAQRHDIPAVHRFPPNALSTFVRTPVLPERCPAIPALAGPQKGRWYVNWMRLAA